MTINFFCIYFSDVEVYSVFVKTLNRIKKVCRNVKFRHTFFNWVIMYKCKALNLGSADISGWKTAIKNKG